MNSLSDPNKRLLWEFMLFLVTLSRKEEIPKDPKKLNLTSGLSHEPLALTPDNAGARPLCSASPVTAAEAESADARSRGARHHQWRGGSDGGQDLQT